MKIVIITQPLRSNYGGILQNYALQTVLKRMGHEPVTLRTGKASLWQRLLSASKNLTFKLLGRQPHFCPLTERFIRKHITATHPQKGYRAGMLKKLSPEALMVGSDQVWRPKFNPKTIEDLFLHFALRYDLPKIAYAASFGTDKWEFSPAQTVKCRKLVKSFRAVSVREESGVKLCREYLDVTAEWVLDPTLLLTSETYNTLCKHIKRSEQPFVFAYFLDLTEDKLRMATTFAEKTQLPLRIISMDAIERRDDSPAKWLASFRDCAYVVTDSFHGTVFSIIYHRNIITIQNSWRGNARFESLADITGLWGRFVQENCDALPTEDIDWKSVDERLETAKERSLCFIKDSLT